MLPRDLFVRYLERLSRLMGTIERHDTQGGGVLHASLAPDMFPLLTQARITANFALRACCQLAAVPVVSFDDTDDTYVGLEEQLRRSREYIVSLVIPGEPRALPIGQDTAGDAAISLPMDEYVHAFALPNFFFHLSMVYAIARAAGVPLGKADFDGYHQYPPGFSFR
ncbi:DUF1993 family protein [Halomonas sp. THAF12]|uniref:DUF1993 family protein n=1 Tax=Halomonas sp. B23F22_10 TaxID=3459515 RepID=UPI00373F3B19